MKHKLSDYDIINAKPKDKHYNLIDGGGLHLNINMNGMKTWVYSYSMCGKSKSHIIGEFPSVSLRQARDRRNVARELVEQANKLDHPAITLKSKKQLSHDELMTYAVIGAMATTGGDAEEAARLLGVTVDFIHEMF